MDATNIQMREFTVHDRCFASVRGVATLVVQLKLLLQLELEMQACDCGGRAPWALRLSSPW